MDEKSKLRVSHLENELKHRVDKLWKIFSWTSSIMVTITGGVIALVKGKPCLIETWERLLISAIVIILMYYAHQWIKENLRLEEETRKQLFEILSNKTNDSKEDDTNPDKASFGYNKVIIGLGITALLATWFVK